MSTNSDLSHPHHDYATTGGNLGGSDHTGNTTVDCHTSARHRTPPRVAVGLLGGTTMCLAIDAQLAKLHQHKSTLKAEGVMMTKNEEWQLPTFGACCMHPLPTGWARCISN
jgi:hypothetical protein